MPLSIWIASFIPKDIPNYTKPIPNGQGKTMIPEVFPGSDCFHTDQRGFSNSPTASCRTRSSVRIDTGTFALQSQSHHSDNTIECDCEDGAEECNKKPDTSKLTIAGYSVLPGATGCQFHFKGGASNPCVAVAPAIDWNVGVIVQREAGRMRISVAPGSKVEPFPAFEMYASLDGTTKLVFKVPPVEGKDPSDLGGDPTEPVTGEVKF